MVSTCVRLVCALSILVLVPHAFAQAPTPVEETSEYQGIVREALAEYNDGNYPEARALFLRAHELKPSARTLRGLGVSAFALRQYEDAVVKLEQALASDVRPLEGGMRAEASKMLERAYGFVGRFAIGVSPGNAQLLVDEVETDLRAGDRLLLSIGRHMVEGRAPGYTADKRSLDVRGGENTGLSLTLMQVPPEPAVIPPPVVQPEPVVAPAPVAVESERPTKAPLYKNPWLWGGVGVAVVAIVIGVSVGASRDHTSVGDVATSGATRGTITWR